MYQLMKPLSFFYFIWLLTPYRKHQHYEKILLFVGDTILSGEGNGYIQCTF